MAISMIKEHDAVSWTRYGHSLNLKLEIRAVKIKELVCATEGQSEVVLPSFRAAALDCWALLSTTIDNVFLAGGNIPGSGDGRGLMILPLLSDSLNSTNLDLRYAAGECVALIHEARENLNASDRRYRRCTYTVYAWVYVSSASE